MRFIRTLALSPAFGCAASCATGPAGPPLPPPNPPNVLDVSFAWTVEKTFKGAGYHGAVLELTSQTWMTEADGK